MPTHTLAESFKIFISAVGAGIPLFIETLVLLFIAKLVRQLATSYDENDQLFNVDNQAVGIAAAGYYIGIMIAFTGVITGPPQGWLDELRDGAIYGILAIIFQTVAGWTADKLILRQFKVNDELIRDKNKGTAWALFGVYFATGMVVRGAIMGDSSSLVLGIESSVVYFILSQFALILIAYFYQVITPYNFHKEIEEDNVAAGLAFGGFVSAVGVILSHASGNTIGAGDILIFICWTILSLVVLSLTRFLVVELILVPGHKIKKEIITDRNENAAWMLVVGFQAVAWLFAFAV
ncbi:MAG: DUF350 domain-containing protein [Desulfobacteraceae bacterium]|jgi:uncharacterized membrane protein YjfL (UPF0719 family)